MNPRIRIELLPLGQTLEVEAGSSLRDILFAHGVEFPCGGRGRCKGCRVRILSGNLPPTAEDRNRLSPEEIEHGWRLSCRARVEGPLRIELAQWEAKILADDSHFGFTPSEGLGIAIDLGTTTLVGQLLDLRTGHVLAVATALNDQARHGADIMSRVDFATHGGGQKTLTHLIRQQLSQLVRELLAAVPARTPELRRVILVGNTVMHHLFSGISVEPLAHTPFEPVHDGLQSFRPADLGWPLPAAAEVQFLPCLGGFVGSDILAGILATPLHETTTLSALMDLGTNGEIVVGTRERMLCASTAAGPAFEGARISTGMRAATGAIAEVRIVDGHLRCRVLGQVEPRGICGSGLVDAVACGLDLRRVQPNGRLTDGARWDIAPPVALVQQDVRELQLAKGAIAAGLRILVQQWGASLDAVERVSLAGAFGNYINRQSAQRIGLLPARDLETVMPAGNTALLGAKLALFAEKDADLSFAELRRRVTHVPLHEDPVFQETYVEEMGFPGAAP